MTMHHLSYDNDCLWLEWRMRSRLEGATCYHEREESRWTVTMLGQP